MTSEQNRRELLARVVARILAHRGRSPESLAASYKPEQPPLSGPSIRRIVDCRDDHLEGAAGEFKLLRLGGMLDLPMGTLVAVYTGDQAEIKRLDFTGQEDVRHGILTDMAAAAKPATKTAAPRRTTRKRAG